MIGREQEERNELIIRFPRSFLPEAHTEEGNRVGTQGVVYEH